MRSLRHPPHLSALVADDLRRAIEAHEYGVDGRLPSEPELARRLGVSRATVRQAITELEGGGFVRRRQGRGTFVTGQATSLRNNLNINSGVTDLIVSAGWTATTADVAFVQRAAARDERDALRLEPGTGVVVVRRTRLADGRPVVAAEDVLSASTMDRVGLSAGALSERLGSGSLYEVLDELGLAVDHGIADIRPVKATGEVSRRLGVPGGSIVVLIQQIDFTSADEPVLLSREHHRPDVFQFRVYRRGPGSRR